MRHVVYDTNYGKSFVHSRLGVGMGDRGCLCQAQVIVDTLIAPEYRRQMLKNWQVTIKLASHHQSMSPIRVNSFRLTPAAILVIQKAQNV